MARAVHQSPLGETEAEVVLHNGTKESRHGSKIEQVIAVVIGVASTGDAAKIPDILGQLSFRPLQGRLWRWTIQNFQGSIHDFPPICEVPSFICSCVCSQ